MRNRVHFFLLNILSIIHFSLKNKIESYPNFFDCRTERAPGKHLLKGNPDFTMLFIVFIFIIPVPRGRRVSSVSDPQLELPEVCFEVEERIGEGAFATVFKVDIIDSSFMDLEAGETNAALKVLNEPSLWEWYIYHQIYERVPKQFVSLIIFSILLTCVLMVFYTTFLFEASPFCSILFDPRVQ